MVLYSWICVYIASGLFSIILPRIGLWILHKDSGISMPLGCEGGCDYWDLVFPHIWTRYQEWIHMSNLCMIFGNILIVLFKARGLKRHFHVLFFKCILLYVPTLTVLWSFIVFLFGAPLWSRGDWIKTCSFALYLSQLTIWIMIWHQKQVHLEAWIRFVLYLDDGSIVNDHMYTDKTQYPVPVWPIYYGRQLYVSMLLFGLWAGSVVVPLDWGQPWQFWPIPQFIAIQATLLAISPVLLITSSLFSRFSYSYTHLPLASFDRK
jgi:hypothetical protein